LRWRPILFLTCLVLSGCTRDASVSLPAQKEIPPGDDPPVSKALLQMNAPDADGWVLDGVAPGGPTDRTRWTHEHPRFRLWLDHVENWKFQMRVQIVDRILQDVGPQTVTITINGSVLDAPRFTSGREYDYIRAVPPGMLRMPGPVDIGLDVSPVWVVPGQGDRLGVLLASIGFVPAGPK
jgi:hypothetical protein